MIKAVAAALVDFALPPRCAACGAIVPDEYSLCASCWQQLEFLTAPGCETCGVPIDPPLRQCAPCMARPPDHDGAAAAVRYGDIARTIILRLKHGRRIGLARFAARLMAAHLPTGDDWVLVPVPLHRWRLWSRGFNQSLLIARAIASGRGLAVAPDWLERHRHTPMLGGKGAAERAKLLAGAIRVAAGAGAALRGRRILLIDDVYTSGATANACARTLKRAGAAEVRVLCWARVLRND